MALCWKKQHAVFSFFELYNTIYRAFPMNRVLRNYLISFALIGLFFLVVHIINGIVENRMTENTHQKTEGAQEPSPSSKEQN